MARMLRAKLGTVPATLWSPKSTAPAEGETLEVYTYAPTVVRFKFQTPIRVHVDRVDEEVGMYFLSQK